MFSRYKSSFYICAKIGLEENGKSFREIYETHKEELKRLTNGYIEPLSEERVLLGINKLENLESLLTDESFGYVKTVGFRKM